MNITSPDLDQLYASLETVFGAEWRVLLPNEQRLIVRDCTEDGGVDDLGQYRRNIGTGNLLAYVACQKTRFARR
jgi:hypothetical protein